MLVFFFLSTVKRKKERTQSLVCLMIRLVIKCFGLAWKRFNFTILISQIWLLGFHIPAATFNCQSPGRINHPINTELMGGMLIRAVNIPPLPLCVISTAIHLFFRQYFFCSADYCSTGAVFPLFPMHRQKQTWRNTRIQPQLQLWLHVSTDPVLIIKVVLCQIITEK